MSGFVLHPRLADDSHLIGDLPLSRVLLADDSRYPWVILVPRRPAVREIFELASDDRVGLLDESCRIGASLMRIFDGEKLNIAALGNLVPQLHLHHVVRAQDDPAWPGPVWGHSPGIPYLPGPLAERLQILRAEFGVDPVDRAKP